MKLARLRSELESARDAYALGYIDRIELLCAELDYLLALRRA